MTHLTKEDAASRLDKCEYRKEGSPELFAAMAVAGLVAVFGASDDLMEFYGAIHDEIGAWKGTTAYLTPSGLLANKCIYDGCPYHAAEKNGAATIKAVWGAAGADWTYRTAIPHVTFLVMKDGEPYCRGIVFALADVSPSVRGAGR